MVIWKVGFQGKGSAAFAVDKNSAAWQGKVGFQGKGSAAYARAQPLLQFQGKGSAALLLSELQLGLISNRFNRFAVDKTQLRLRCSRSISERRKAILVHLNYSHFRVSQSMLWST